MKKIRKLVLALCLAAALAIPAQAAPVQTAPGYVRQTGIQAQIDGHPLRSYNVNGRTAVVVMDLVDYGFNVIWDGAERTFWVEQGTAPAVWPAQAKSAGGESYVRPTDVAVYVAGEAVECFQVGSETAIYLEELTRYGQLQWIAQEQTARLVVTQDPMKLGLDQEIAGLKAWDPSASYQLYTGQEGTLFVGQQDLKTSMIFFEKNGTRVSLTELMPQTAQGAEYYVRPSQVKFDRTGGYLTFMTPLQGGGEGDGAARLDWGNVLCSYDIQRRAMTFGVPGDDGYTSSLARAAQVVQLCRTLEDWRVSAGSGSWYQMIERADFTLFQAVYTGTPHGVSSQLVLVKEDGSTVDLIMQLPEYGEGASYYARIQELTVSGDGSAITFRTRVPGEAEGSWAQALCSVNPDTGALTVTVEQAQSPAEGTDAPSGGAAAAR